jgi:PAS domain S-box-containing protein
MSFDRVKALLVVGDASEAARVQEALGHGQLACDVEHVQTLGAALARLGTTPYDAVLVDLELPDSHGLATFDEVRSRALNAVVLVLTDTNTEALGLAAMQKGAQGHYVKGSAWELLNLTLLHSVERLRLGAEVERRNRDARGSEAALLLVMETNPDGMVIVDANGLARYVNRAAAALFGLKIEDMVGKPFPFQLEPGETKEVEMLKAKGERSTAEFRVMETVWRGNRVFLAALRDLSRGAQAEEAARSAEERLRALVNQAPVAVVEVNKQLAFTILAGKRLAALGLKLGDIGRSARDVARQAPQLVEDLQHALTGEPYASVIEVAGATFDLQCIPLRDKRGQVAGALAIAVDITEANVAEGAKRISLQRLMEIERLKEINRTKTHLLNLASRELNTPLTPIKMQLHILRSDPSLGKSQRRSLEILERSVGRLALMVQNVLDVARLESGHLDLKKDVVDLRNVASEVVDQFAEGAKAQEIHLDLHMPAALWVEVDRTRIAQVCSNLLSNAVKYTPKGGRITVEAKWEQGACVVRVHDSGVGLTPERMAIVFQPYVAAHDARGEPHVGTGLSLYISKGIVEEHGGRIWCESPGPGQGSTFSFALPPRGSVTTTGWIGRTAPAEGTAAPPVAPSGAGNWTRRG